MSMTNDERDELVKLAQECAEKFGEVGFNSTASAICFIANIEMMVKCGYLSRDVLTEVVGLAMAVSIQAEAELNDKNTGFSFSVN